MPSPAARARPVRYIAFLRAINVGGRVVKMDALRAHFEALRVTAVESFIASGNVIFLATSADPTALEQRIEARLAAHLGYGVATFLRTPAELAAIVAQRPFGPIDPLDAGHALSVAFVRSPPAPAAAANLLALTSPVDDFHLAGREIFWRCRVRVSESKVSGALLEKALATSSTVRNITTIRKLAALYPPSAA